MFNVGVLGLQGSVSEHILCLKSAGMNPVQVKTIDDLKTIDGLILPGGESTAIGILLNEFGLHEPLVEMIKSGLPVWGTCAGMILLAKTINGQTKTHLSVMDIEVKRNAFGNQLDSFDSYLNIPEVSNNPIHTIFIRAPYIERVYGDARALASIDGQIVAARQHNMLATAFHPELTGDISFYRYFNSIIE